MTPQEFVTALKSECRNAAVSGCLQTFQTPPGRKVDPALVKLSEWYKSLSATGQENVAAAMQQAADAMLFGVLCVIDGVRVVESHSEKSEFHLTAIRQGTESVLAPGSEFLHDILRAEP